MTNPNDPHDPPQNTIKITPASGAKYSFGVRVLARITTNIVNADGGAVPPLTKGSPFSWSGTITASIPFMELTQGK
jgi:hypothetical protein